MTPVITPIYAGLLALIFLALSMWVVKYRRRHMISLGDNDDKALRKRMRVQANFVEYVPLAIVLLLLAELASTPGWVLHALGAALVIGRICHAYGMGSYPQVIILRQIGVVLTVAVILILALGLIGHALI